jgi:hypothetical protein
MKTLLKNGQRVWWKDPAGENSGYRTITCDVQQHLCDAIKASGEEAVRKDGFMIQVVDEEGAESDVLTNELEPVSEHPYDELVRREKELRHDMELHILQCLRQNDGRVSLKIPENDDDCEGFEFPVTTALYGRHSNDNVDITDVYVERNQSTIYADGLVNGVIQRGYQLHPEQYSDALWFIVSVLYR